MSRLLHFARNDKKGLAKIVWVGIDSSLALLAMTERYVEIASLRSQRQSGFTEFASSLMLLAMTERYVEIALLATTKQRVVVSV